MAYAESEVIVKQVQKYAFFTVYAFFCYKMCSFAFMFCPDPFGKHATPAFQAVTENILPRQLSPHRKQMKISIINKSHHPLPSYATALSAGMDLRANISSPITLRPLERNLVPTGLYIALPAGYEGQVRPRSGLATKHGITVVNAPGTIDADYRGELRVSLINLSNEDFVIEDGERIAQLVVARHETVEWEETESLDETARGAGGWGSTGSK